MHVREGSVRAWEGVVRDTELVQVLLLIKKGEDVKVRYTKLMKIVSTCEQIPANSTLTG